MYAQVIVPAFKGPNVDSFTYEVPPDLQIKIGQLVIVPFGKVKEMGVVLGTRNQRPGTSYNVKAIDSIVLEKPFLLPYQMELLKWMAQYYLATMGNCLNAMLPELPNSQSLIVNSSSSVTPVNDTPYTINKQQTIVLVPTINHLPNAMAQFPKAKSYTTFTSEQTPKEKLAKWLTTKAGSYDYIFGSRSAVFTPCPNLKKIIIFDEHDSSYKDQQTPYYDTLTVAQMISKLTGAKVEVVDSSPKVTTYFQTIQSKNIKVGPRWSSGNNQPLPKVKIVSMIEEKLTDNKTPISNYLKTLLARAQEKNLNCLLFLNKKQESGNLYCRACRTEQRLPKEPEVCPNCGSREFWFYSLNINTLKKLVKQQVKGARVNIISNERGLSSQVTASGEERPRQPAIDIATSAVFYRLIQKKYALVANISTDSPLNVTDYTSAERAYAQIANLKKLAAKVLILQTYNPDNPVIIQAAQGDYKTFATNQLEERKTLSYPPYSQLIKLVLKGKVRETVERRAEKISADLRSNLLTINLTPQREAQGAHGTVYLPLTILGPYAPFFRFRSSRYNIVIKISTSQSNPLPQIAPILKLQKVDQLIVDPDTLN